MLVAHMMGSHGGQQNFPFGYDPNELHGIGLPDFMTPGPPPGPPILDEHENQELNSFFTGFGASASTGKDGHMAQYAGNIGQNQGWMMPPTFVGSETSLRPRSGGEWNNMQVSEPMFGNEQAYMPMSQPQDYRNPLQAQNFNIPNQYDNDPMQQLRSAATLMQPGFPQGWQPSFQDHNFQQIPHPPKQLIHFGSDAQFHSTGYAPPSGQVQPDVVANLDWLEADSSATNTQPNTQPNTRPSTRPNTQPSSPNVSRKRKFNDQFDSSRPNGFVASKSDGAQRASIHTDRQSSKKSSIKIDTHDLPQYTHAQSATGSANLIAHSEVESEDDADFDDEEEEFASRQQASPSIQHDTKSKRSKGHATAQSKAARPRKKSSISEPHPGKSRPNSSRSSIGGASSSRVPLSADQKKANHTNSEQRRRDATARAYAELYDLVPELEEIGKQSTMKKLELIVAKVATVKNRVAQLRAMLGIDPDVSLSQITAATNAAPYASSGTASSSANIFGADQRTWQR